MAGTCVVTVTEHQFFATHPLRCMRRTIAHDITHGEFEPRALKKPNWLGEGDFLSIPRPEKRPPLYMFDHFR